MRKPSLKHQLHLGISWFLSLAAYFCLVGGMKAADGTVTFDFYTTVRHGSPYVFGGVEFPMKAQEDDFYPKLKEAGVTFLRSDLNGP